MATCIIKGPPASSVLANHSSWSLTLCLTTLSLRRRRGTPWRRWRCSRGGTPSGSTWRTPTLPLSSKTTPPSRRPPLIRGQAGALNAPDVRAHGSLASFSEF
eukprot:3889548-Pyramimonas_sp.AAC.1